MEVGLWKEDTEVSVGLSDTAQQRKVEGQLNTNRSRPPWLLCPVLCKHELI